MIVNACNFSELEGLDFDKVEKIVFPEQCDISNQFGEFLKIVFKEYVVKTSLNNLSPKTYDRWGTVINDERFMIFDNKIGFRGTKFISPFYENKQFHFPCSILRKKLKTKTETKKKDENKQNVYAFQFNLMKAVIKGELEAEGITVPEDLIFKHCRISPCAYKKGIRQDLNIGDDFLLVLNIYGKTGYTSFDSLPWKSVKQIIIALNL